MSEASEHFKTEVCKFTEETANEALSGEIRGLVVLKFANNGQMYTSIIGISPIEALGGCFTAANIMQRKILA